jgi:ketosteroid isomerase-like protein
MRPCAGALANRTPRRLDDEAVSSFVVDMRLQLLTALLVTVAGCATSRAVHDDATHAAHDVADLDAFLADVDAATQSMINGDRRAWEQLYSHAPDATLFGGWGGHERGWDELEPRWRMVTGRYRSGKLEPQLLARHVSGELAVTVQLFSGEAAFADGTAGPVGLRVTHVLRREGGAWRIVHRHADEALKLRPIESHIQKP